MANILLVEDDRWLADCFNTWLAADGHKIYHVTDAHDAMNAVDTNGCQVIVLDLLLANTNGVQLLHALQSYPDLVDVPVVLCSASVSNSSQDFAAYGVHQVIDKTTLSPTILRNAIKKALTRAAV